MRHATLLLVAATLSSAAEPPLPGTQPLTARDDLALQMVAGMGRYLARETAATVSTRPAPSADRLARIIGAIDARRPGVEMAFVATTAVPAKVAETDRFAVYAVSWEVFDGVHGEGLLLQPHDPPVARIVLVPDADQTPEMLAGLSPALASAANSAPARRLAENGAQVLIPVLVDRSDEFSGSTVANRFTNLPHREWIYRQAYLLGRHIIGYEVQKVLAAVDWFERQNQGTPPPRATPPPKIGVAGWGEGGLIALHAAALDRRIDATLISGHFGPRERLAEEPIYRNLFGLLREFGDAELARLIAPRSLLVEPAASPAITGPPAAREGRRNTAAPGRLTTPAWKDVLAEVERARRLAGDSGAAIELCGESSAASGGPPWAESNLARLLERLTKSNLRWRDPGPAPRDLRAVFDPRPRQERTVRELERFTQRLWQLSADAREKSFWAPPAPTTPAAWRDAMRPSREKFWHEVIGRLPPSTEARSTAMNPRTRFLRTGSTWTAHEVLLDVAPDIIATGILLLPKNLGAGEKRPVVIAQHGLNSTAADVIDDDPNSKFYHQFKGLGVQLVERGFIVFAPVNPYRGSDTFRHIQRQANPLGLSIFSFIVAQHDRILDWLATLPSVDPARIGFYGLSYGGKTALRVPAILDRYAVSVCSGDFNEWIWKNVTPDWDRSYMFTNEYEMPEWNLGYTFSYGEMAAMIAPRPFMVERGHDDTVGRDEWVAFEYAKVQRLYAKLKIPHLTGIEYFDGPHAIHGVGTFKFLHRHLAWPEPASTR